MFTNSLVTSDLRLPFVMTPVSTNCTKPGSLQKVRGQKSEVTREFFCYQIKYSKSLSWTANLNFPPKPVDNLFKFSAQDSDLECLICQCRTFPISSDSKPPLIKTVLTRDPLYHRDHQITLYVVWNPTVVPNLFSSLIMKLLKVA